MQALVTTGSWNPLASTNIAGDDPVNANSHQHSHLHSSILNDIKVTYHRCTRPASTTTQPSVL